MTPNIEDSLSPSVTTNKILIVEDDYASRLMFKELARSCGAENAKTAKNFEEAVSALKVGDVSVLITDIHMPNGDGLELIRRARATKVPFNGEHMGIIALTGDGRKQMVYDVMRSGADAFLVKPINRKKFEARLELAIKLAAQRQKAAGDEEDAALL